MSGVWGRALQGQVERSPASTALRFPRGTKLLRTEPLRAMVIGAFVPGLGCDLIARGLGAPLLVVADGAPWLIKAIEECWPASDRQHRAVHRAGRSPG